MPTYIIYDKNNGEILHVHKEYYMGAEQPVAVDEKRLLAELGETLPKGIETGILAVEETPQPVRGYRYYVDLRTARLMLVERPRKEKELTK